MITGRFDRHVDGAHSVIGMVHLPALPGSPGFDGDREAIRDRMLEDARRLEAGGIDAIMVENFGDAPFYPEDVPTHVVADLTALASDLVDAVDVPVGINVLRNDAIAALSIAAAVGAAFIRVNVHVGAAATDQGVVEGQAHETLRLRDRLDADVAILADVHVKHATPIGEARIEETVIETVERGRADGIVVSGPGTGRDTSLDDIERVVDAVSATDRSVPVLVGSGVTQSTIGDCLEAGADGAIVGTALKEDGVTTNPVSEARVSRLIAATREYGTGSD